MNVDDYAGRDGMLAFYRDCRRLAKAGEVGQLVQALSTKASRTYEKHEVARIAAGVLASMNSTGIAALGRFLESADIGGLRASAALRALWLASQGLSPVGSVLGVTYPVEPVALELQAQARVVLDDFIAAASTSADHSRVLFGLQQQELTLSGDGALPPLAAQGLGKVGV